MLPVSRRNGPQGSCVDRGAPPGSLVLVVPAGVAQRTVYRTRTSRSLVSGVPECSSTGAARCRAGAGGGRAAEGGGGRRRGGVFRFDVVVNVFRSAKCCSAAASCRRTSSSSWSGSSGRRMGRRGRRVAKVPPAKGCLSVFVRRGLTGQGACATLAATSRHDVGTQGSRGGRRTRASDCGETVCLKSRRDDIQPRGLDVARSPNSGLESAHRGACFLSDGIAEERPEPTTLSLSA